MSKSTAMKKLLLLSREDRLRTSTRGGNQRILVASESDKGRVINSSAFRRLQQKAQVFPLEPNAAVRTRLTHSIEVSQIGRYLAQEVIHNLEGHDEAYGTLTAFANNIETACLLHDIGNPPFGHLGESAIQEHFTEKGESTSAAPGYSDLTNFDGNPQGFRLISFLSGQDAFGLNLTCTQLLSTIKYPWDLAHRQGDEKIGLFESDYPSYLSACEQLGWVPGKKFPLAHLMDTADEIAYSMSDLEDGIEKGIISIEEVEHAVGQGEFDSSTAVETFILFKTRVITRAVQTAAKTFADNIEDIVAGAMPELIPSQGEIGGLLKSVTNLARTKVYTDAAAEQVELAGRSVLKGLLRHFDDLLALDEDDFSALIENDGKAIKKRKLQFQARLLRRLPSRYIEKYKVETRGSENLRRAHLIVDFVSGMTDDFALQTYQILEGIRVK